MAKKSTRITARRNPDRHQESLSLTRKRGNQTLILDSPSAAAHERLHSIPLLFDRPKVVSTLIGGIAHDSWAGQAIGRRDVTDGHLRRLGFEAGRLKCELIIERQRRHWEFIARVYIDDIVAHNYVLEFGRRKLLPRSGGFYQWTSPTVARAVRLRSLDQLVDLGEIKW